MAPTEMVNSSGAGDVRLDVNRIQSSCNEEMRQPSLAASIYKVPAKIRASQQETYDPQVVGLGLFHANMFPSMEERKTNAKNNTLKKICKKQLTKNIGQMVKRIKDCYEDLASSICYSDENIAETVIMDACFIIDFYKNFKETKKSDWRINLEILRDIFKLENQIPLFVLLEIQHQITPQSAADLNNVTAAPFNNVAAAPFNNVAEDPFNNVAAAPFNNVTEAPFNNVAAVHSLAEMLASHPPFKILQSFQSPITLQQSDLVDLVEKHIKEDANHLLDLLSKAIQDFLKHSSLKPCECLSFLGSGATEHSNINIFHALELEKYGIKFKKSMNGEVRFAKTWYLSNTLYLPQINIEKDTLLLNLIYFVDRSGEDTVVFQFMRLMNGLIGSKEECVALLRRQEIVHYANGTDAKVASSFSELCNEISPDYCRFHNVLNKVKKKCTPINLFLSEGWKITILVAGLSTFIGWLIPALNVYYSSKRH